MYPGTGGRSGMMLMRWDVSLDLRGYQPIYLGSFDFELAVK